VSQPTLGLVSSALVMAVSLGLVSLFRFDTFAGWVSFLLLGSIPMQIVIAVHWGTSPSFAAGLRQPLKGLVLTLVMAAATVVASPLVLAAIGEGVSPPGVVPSHFAIIVVPTTFWLAIMMGGWPFAGGGKGTVGSGLALLVASYAITWVVFRVCFGYAFLEGTPADLASAPDGLFNGVMALVFYVTALAVMFLLLCFDLWPLTLVPALRTQPALGMAWTVAALAGAAVAMTVGVVRPGADPMAFLTNVTVPFIFGTIVVLNMLQDSLFGRQRQPVKGVLNAIAAAAIGLVLAHLYRSLAPITTGALAAGPPAYEAEIWLANALLSVTFPLLILHAALFGYWPLAGAPARAPTVAGPEA
jgi:hypothetical protein